MSGKKKKSLVYTLLKNDKIRQQILDGVICVGMIIFLIIAEVTSNKNRSKKDL